MALIERLMHDESEPTSRWIPVHDFFAAASEVERGGLTSAKVKAFWAMTAPDIADFDAMVAQVTGAAAPRLATIQKFHAVFMLAEGRYPEYSTPAEVRTKLGI